MSLELVLTVDLSYHDFLEDDFFNGLLLFIILFIDLLFCIVLALYFHFSRCL